MLKFVGILTLHSIVLTRGWCQKYEILISSRVVFTFVLSSTFMWLSIEWWGGYHKEWIGCACGGTQVAQVWYSKVYSLVDTTFITLAGWFFWSVCGPSQSSRRESYFLVNVSSSLPPVWVRHSPQIVPRALGQGSLLLSSPHGVLDVLRVESDKKAKYGEEHHAVGGQHKATRSTIDLKNKLIIREMMMVI